METTALDAKKTADGRPLLADLSRHPIWWVLVGICVIALISIYRTPFQWEWREWWKEESYYSHGVLIPFISAFAVYINWKKIVSARLEPSVWGFVILIPAMLLQFVAYRAGIPSVSGMTLPIVILGMTLLLFGVEAAKELAFPILFLIFMCVPPTQYLERVSFKIQMLSTTYATYGLKIFRIQAAQSGTTIHLSALPVVVGAPCSGFRTLIALLAFGTFLAYLKQGPLWGKLVMVAAIFPLAIIVNSIRVMLIAMVGEFYGEGPMRVFHDYAGLPMIAVALILLFLFSKVVKCRDFRPMPLS